ncbi:toxin glutamine deamidase domain-containing protein [Streptomyces sp. NPDC049627]|uniref:toxin glutamine deamidase domain-containing protein n=1 Tax=Streptomyces sp. NPDC049627 TaxID=3365595 RepID=UPI0037B1F98B
MMLPDELEWVLEMLGYKWPTANEDKLRDCAAVWRQFGETVTDLHTKANTSAGQVLEHNAGESIDKFRKTYEKFDGGGGQDGYLRNAADAAFLIANVLEACAYLVEFAKWAVIAQLIALVIEIAAAHAAAPFTFGLSEVAGLGATQVTRLIVRRLLDELKQALIDALIETMKEPAISAVEAMITDLIRQTVNVGFGAQEGYNIGATIKAGGEAGLDALRQSPQTFLEGVRDSLGEKAGSRARHAVDSRIEGYDGPSGGDVGSDGGNSGSGSSDGSGESGSDGSNSSSDNSSSSNSSSSDSSSSGSDSSTSTRASNGPGVNIGGGISADTGGNDIGAPDVGAGPDPGSGPGPGSDSGSPSSSDSPYSRPTPSAGPSLSDFDDPSPGGTSPGGADSNGSSGTPSTSGPSHSGGGSPVSGLSSPTVQSAPTPSSSGGTSSSPGGGSIGTQIDGLAASAPTQSNAVPTTADSSATGTGGRPDGGSGIPTSPTAPSTGGAAPGTGTQHAPSGSGGTPSSTSPTPNSGPARNPSPGTPTTPSTTGTGPASTPSPTSPTTPRSTPTPTPDGRIPGTADGRTPGTSSTPDGRIPTQRTPGSTTPGDGTAPRTTPGNTTPGDRSTPANTPGTTPGDRTSPRNTSDPSTGTRTTTPGQNPSTTSPGQNPSQSTPTRTPSPSTSTPASTPSTGTGPGRASTPNSGTPNSSPQPGPGTHSTAQGTPGTPSTPNQPSVGSTPTRPPHHPAGNTPNTPSTPNTPNQPGTQPHTQQSPANTPNQQQQPQVTPVPIHHVTPAPNNQPHHSTPQNPDSTPNSPNQQNSDSPKPKEPPTPASETRNTTPPGGVIDPTRAEQDALENSVPRDENGDPTRPPDPADGNWVERINGEGRDAPGRNNNCVDVALSTVDTYAGNPTAAASRTPDTDADGTPSDRGEKGGRDRIENTLGARFSDMGNGRDAFNRLENTLRNSGHGSQAVIITQDSNGRAHAWNAVNHNGKITYIDAQTGQQSSKPLHSGDNGVFAIPLDSNRQPVTPDGTGNAGRSTPDSDRQAPDTAGTTDRRPAEDPAGAPQESDPDNTDEKPHPRDDPQRREHPRLTEPETVDSSHYGMNPMPDQQNVRQTNNVRQLDMDPVHQQLNNWLNPVPTEDGTGTRVPLVDALQSCSPPRPDDPDHEPRILRHDDLVRILPGFGDMHPGERGAVVASLARLSLKFHESHAVSASPEPLDGYPKPAVAKHAKANWAPSRRDEEITAALINDLGGVAASINDAGEHRPDFTGRNYATVEVYDPVSKQISYVVDSSYPGTDNKHSEKNILDYLDKLNEQREENAQYEPLSMYTDREPCGRGGGYANCARLLSERMPGVDVFYGTGYRKEAEIVDPDALDPDITFKQQFENDLIENLNEIGKVWIRAMKDGGLKGESTPEG